MDLAQFFIFASRQAQPQIHSNWHEWLVRALSKKQYSHFISFDSERAMMGVSTQSYGKLSSYL
jgi:hypothetical protein